VSVAPRPGARLIRHYAYRQRCHATLCVGGAYHPPTTIRGRRCRWRQAEKIGPRRGLTVERGSGVWLATSTAAGRTDSSQPFPDAPTGYRFLPFRPPDAARLASSRIRGTSKVGTEHVRSAGPITAQHQLNPSGWTISDKPALKRPSDGGEPLDSFAAQRGRQLPARRHFAATQPFRSLSGRGGHCAQFVSTRPRPQMTPRCQTTSLRSAVSWKG
jgi:hypothetical protein